MIAQFKHNLSTLGTNHIAEKFKHTVSQSQKEISFNIGFTLGNQDGSPNVSVI